MDVTLAVPFSTLAKFVPTIKRRWNAEHDGSEDNSRSEDVYLQINVKGTPLIPLDLVTHIPSPR